MRAVELEPAAPGYGFFVTYDEAGVLERVTEVFGLGPGGFTFGSGSAGTLEAGEDGAALITFPRVSLAAVVPSFDPSMERRISARLDPPPPSLRRAELGAELAVELALPRTDSRIYLPGLEGGGAPLVPGAEDGAAVTDPRLIALARSAAQQITLVVPVDHERCGVAGGLSLEAFASTADALEPLDEAGLNRDFIRVVRIDAERALAMSATHVILQRRGLPLERLPAQPGPPGQPGQQGSYFARADFRPPGEAPFLTDVALDRRVTADGAMIATTLGHYHYPSGPVTTIWELAIRGDRLQVVSTATVPMMLRSVSIDDSGARVFAGDDGDVMISRPGRTGLDRLPSLPIPEALTSLRVRIRFTGDPDTPLLAGSGGQLHLFDAASESWRSRAVTVEELGLGRAGDPDEPVPTLDALLSLDGGAELWGAGSLGALYRRRRGEDWTRVELLPPPDYSPCSRPARDYPEARITDRIDDLAGSGEHLYLSIRGCSAVIEVRRGDLCARAIGVGGAPPGPFERGDLQALGLHEGALAVAGERGLLYDRPLR